MAGGAPRSRARRVALGSGALMGLLVVLLGVRLAYRAYVRSERAAGERCAGGRFVIHDDLVWQSDAPGLGLRWERSPSTERLDYEHAVARCASLSMRLPTSDELISITDMHAGEDWPLDRCAFPPDDALGGDWGYRTSSYVHAIPGLTEAYPTEHLVVHYAFDYAIRVDDGELTSVRCVGD